MPHEFLHAKCLLSVEPARLDVAAVQTYFTTATGRGHPA